MKTLVITPTLGVSRWLDETVASVAALPAPCHHVIVCPAGVRSDLARRFPRAQLVVEPGGGMYAAINAGVAAATDWDVFTYLNDDDVLCADGTAQVWRRFEQEPSVDVVYGRVGLMDTNGAPQGWLPVAHRPGDLTGLLAREMVPLAQPGTWMRRGIFQRLGGFTASFQLAGDLDLFSRALAAAARFEFVPAEVARFRLHAGQLSKHEAAAEAEMILALARWLDHPTSWGSLLRFRWDNLPVYLDRIRRHGFVSMRRLYRGT